MPSRLLERAHTELARSMFRDIYNANDHYYVFIGRTYEWPDESTAPDVVDNIATQSQTRRDIVFAKRTAPTDIVFLIRNIEWIENTVYDRYDDNISIDNPTESGTTTLDTANFYVLTEDFNVYKCINNNKGAPSTERPTGTTTEIFTTADGYMWKFMYQVPVLDRTKFLSPEWLPVRHYTGGYHFDVNGFLESVDVISGGSGYVQATTHVVIDGDGKGAMASATVAGGAVTDVDVFVDEDAEVHSGDGYSFIFASILGAGTGAVLRANLGRQTIMPVNDAVPEAAIPGGIHVIDILIPGEDYLEENTSVTIDGDGEGAEARAVIVDGTVDRIEITNPGVNYNWIEVTINSPIGFGATARGIISPQGGHGFDSVDELYAKGFSVMVNMGVLGDEPDLFVDNAYRQLGLIKNLKEYDGVTQLSGVTATACYVANVPNTAEYNVGDIITSDDGGEFRVVQILNPEVWLQPIKDYITDASTLTNETTQVDSLLINSLTDPELDVYTGELLYVNNKIKVDRVTEQTETLQIFFSF